MFNFKKKFAALGVLISSLFFSSALLAADFTFNVPVKFTNLHENIERVSVTCEIKDRSGNLIVSPKHGNMEVSNGKAEGTIIVPINAGQNNRERAFGWKCMSKVCQINGDCKKLSSTAESGDFKSAPGSSLVIQKAGRL